LGETRKYPARLLIGNITRKKKLHNQIFVVPLSSLLAKKFLSDADKIGETHNKKYKLYY
jgi:hypothetical protein